MPEVPRYRFHPLERRGVLLGLGPAQLATVGAGVLTALILLRRGPGGAGLLAGIAAVGASVVLACWPIAGHPPVAWAPVSGRWLLRRRRGTSMWHPGSTLAPPGVVIMDAPIGPGEDPLGVVHDRTSGAWSVVLTVGSGSFTLLDPEEKQRRLGAWGAVLASAGRAGSPVHRLQWIERTDAGDADALAEYLRESVSLAGRPVLPTDAERAMLASYTELIDQAGAVHQAHGVLLVLSVHPRQAARQLRSFGRGPQATCALLRRELRLLQGQLRSAEVHPGRALDADQVAAAIQMVTQPGRRSRGRATASSAWPMAVDEQWASVHVDDRWHATYWVAEWPRIEVGADFLAPLLLVGGTRAVSLTMAPVPPARAIREVESARTADLADAELRRRAGFLSTARHRREAEGAVNREAELADGHSSYRLCGYVSASAATPADLEGVCAELEQAAQQSHLELRRLYGQQREALTWTLPLGRGLS